MGGMGGMGGRSASGRAAPRKDPPIESTLNMTLEELYSGTTKKMKISRNVSAGCGCRARWAWGGGDQAGRNSSNGMVRSGSARHVCCMLWRAGLEFADAVACCA